MTQKAKLTKRAVDAETRGPSFLETIELDDTVMYLLDLTVTRLARTETLPSDRMGIPSGYVVNQNAPDALIEYIHIAGIIGHELHGLIQNRIFMLFRIDHHHLFIGEQFIGEPRSPRGYGYLDPISLSYLEGMLSTIRALCSI